MIGNEYLLFIFLIDFSCYFKYPSFKEGLAQLATLSFKPLVDQ